MDIKERDWRQTVVAHTRKEGGKQKSCKVLHKKKEWNCEMKSLNKIISHHIIYVNRPKIILSDPSNEFATSR